jgi:tetratricopeptide (TPR) repeat protein
MTPLAQDQTDPATLAAAEGEAALGVGDTALARQKHAEAGAILERQMSAAYKGADKQLLRFLAATQYYRGGHYQKALELANKIQARLLRKDIRALLPQFLRDAKLRSSPGYETGVRKTLHKAWLGGEYQRALELFQEHPYVVDPGRLAFLRATLCERLGEYRAAAIFFARALRTSLDDVDLLITTVTLPLRLSAEGRLAEAWEYAQHQVELFPHTVTFLTASIVSFHRALSGKAEERKLLFEETLRFLNKAWENYLRLSEVARQHPAILDYLDIGFEVGAVACIKAQDKDSAQQIVERVDRLPPITPQPKGSRARAFESLRVFLQTDRSKTTPSEEFANSAVKAFLDSEKRFGATLENESKIQEMLQPVAS